MQTIYHTPRVTRTFHADGSFSLVTDEPLGAYPARILEYLKHWATRDPDRHFLAERGPAGAWAYISYGSMFESARATAQFLLDRGCSHARPLAILTENSIGHAVMELGAIYAGIPVVPISAAYSTLPEAFERLVYCLSVVTPGALYVEDGERLGGVLARIAIDCGIRIARRNPLAGMVSFEEVAATPVAKADSVYTRTGEDTIIKVLFTSGSTGMPKGAINTNRMVCANQQQLYQAFPFLADHTPRLVDWLPWSHTFGGNETFFMTMRHGGTMYIDAGKPMGPLFQQSVRNLKDVAPTLYLNVPLGYDMLATAMEQDEQLRRNVFRDLDMLFYAGSALPQATWRRFERFSEEVRGHKVPFVTAWGTTETAPLATAVYFPTDNASNIGVPVSGCEIKLVPLDDRFEIRVKGPNVTPGYWRDPQKTAALFDEHGYYRPGDAAKLADNEDPSKGMLFDGRVAEDFKLSSGTWVPVGKIRNNVINAVQPLAQDAVVVGSDWDYVGVLIFADHQGCQKMCGEIPRPNEHGLIDNQRLLDHLKAGLAQMNVHFPGSSMRVRRAVLMFEPPSLKGYEITEKGYVNQRAVQIRRKALVDHLRSSGAGVVLLD